jgi:predicted N-acetyltransferase YhbS
LIQRALKDARDRGYKLVVLVGDEPFYAKAGFKRIAKGLVKMPGPVDPARLLINELVPGAFEGVAGMIRPDWIEQSGA